MTDEMVAHWTAQPSHPFDAAAPGYDAAFTGMALGRWLRAVVWERLDAAFAAGDTVLELGCGTGEDARHLASRGVNVVATDVSAAMLHCAQFKIATAGLEQRVKFARLDLSAASGLADVREALRDRAPDGPFDGAFSSFGPLNCVENRVGLAAALAAAIRPGGRLVLVVMGPICPWEVVWHLAHGDVRRATRRLRRRAKATIGDARRISVWYPSLPRLVHEFGVHFRPVESAGLGVVLPPSDMGPLVERAMGIFERLRPVDRFLCRLPLVKYLADHYILVLERRL